MKVNVNTITDAVTMCHLLKNYHSSEIRSDLKRRDGEYLPINRWAGRNTAEHVNRSGGLNQRWEENAYDYVLVFFDFPSFFPFISSKKRKKKESVTVRPEWKS